MAIVRFSGKVKKIRCETDTVKIIGFDLSEEFSLKAGQFIMVHFEQNDEEVSRAYSVAYCDGKYLELCVKVLEKGVASRYLDSLVEGELVFFSGPFGRFVLRDLERDCVFIGTGTGVAPFRFMVEEYLKQGVGVVTVLMGYRDTDSVLYEKEFKGLLNKYPDRFNYIVVLSRPQGEYVYTGHVQDFLNTIEIQDSDYYLCGLGEMVFDVRESLEKQGVKRTQIFFERYD